MVVCKKDYVYNSSFINSRNSISFIKNKNYKISDSSYWDEEKKVVIYQIETWSFVSTNEIHNLFVPNFYDYFYTKKEIRKMKLNKINNERD